jgi:hypothetical protein
MDIVHKVLSSVTRKSSEKVICDSAKEVTLYMMCNQRVGQDSLAYPRKITLNMILTPHELYQKRVPVIFLMKTLQHLRGKDRSRLFPSLRNKNSVFNQNKGHVLVAASIRKELQKINELLSE